MNKWAELLGIPHHECKGTGHCCRFSSPSTPGIILIEKAGNGDEFARDYLSVFVPYQSIEEVIKLNPELVEKNLKVLEMHKCKEVTQDNLVFYHCRYLDDNNRCMVYEDRPSLCREFPDSPLLVLAPGCGYEEWAAKCKEKYFQLKQRIKEREQELLNLRYQKNALRVLNQLQRINDEEYKLAFVIPSSLRLVSPRTSWIKWSGG
jgi:Fe-S-cluster containining protein